jgi:hypothetical protein
VGSSDSRIPRRPFIERDASPEFSSGRCAQAMGRSAYLPALRARWDATALLGHDPARVQAVRIRCEAPPQAGNARRRWSPSPRYSLDQHLLVDSAL